MSGLRGDVKKLSGLGKALKGLPVRVRTRVAARVAPELTARARASFEAGENPYGDTWAPGADGQRVTLRKSDRLFGTLHFVTIGTKVRAVLGVKYAKYQIGKRGILPQGGTAMPVSWSRAIGAIAVEEIQRDLAGAV